MSQVAWADLLRLGARELGLRPAEFWVLTPAEFMLMAGIEEPAAPSRQTLGALMRAYPDNTKREAGDG